MSLGNATRDALYEAECSIEAKEKSLLWFWFLFLSIDSLNSASFSFGVRRLFLASVALISAGLPGRDDDDEDDDEEEEDEEELGASVPLLMSLLLLLLDDMLFLLLREEEEETDEEEEEVEEEGTISLDPLLNAPYFGFGFTW